ncbi:MAG: hypothetical protein U0441_17355 [Polyangiaceae bacterium]
MLRNSTAEAAPHDTPFHPVRTGHLRTGLLTLLLAAGCSGAPPVAEVRIDPSKKGAPSANEGDHLATVVALERPQALAIDGDIGEWGNILPPPPKPAPAPAPATRKAAAPSADATPSKGKATPKKEPRTPPVPASHLAIAIDSDGVSIAGMLGGEAVDGLWIGVRLGDVTLPPIGSMARWGGVVELDCENGPDGNPRDAEDAKSCNALITAREDFGEAQSARFRRMYRLDRKGLRSVDAKGALVPVPGAKVAFKDGKAGVTVEAAFPQKALPRTDSAPLARIGVSVRAGSEGDPPKDGGAFEEHDLPVAVGFEPYASLRAAAFQLAADHSLGAPGLSYQPGDGVELEEVGYAGGDTTSLAIGPHVLFERLTTWNGFEVGYAYVIGDAVAVLDKSGTLISIQGMQGNPMGFVERDGELQVFGYWDYQPGDDSAERAEWSAVAVQKDGSLRSNLIETTGANQRWVVPAEFHDKDFSRFGVRGQLADNNGGPPETGQTTWVWNPKERAYGVEMADDEPEPPAKGKASLPKSKPSPKKGKGKK